MSRTQSKIAAAPQIAHPEPLASVSIDSFVIPSACCLVLERRLGMPYFRSLQNETRGPELTALNLRE
jgi:hypothetical protein